MTCREITPEDLIAENNKGYEIGRKHGRGEMGDLLDWAEKLLRLSIPMVKSAEWTLKVESWSANKEIALPKKKEET